MQSSLRVLVASPLHHIAEVVITQEIPTAGIATAGSLREFKSRVVKGVRHDVVLLDLDWGVDARPAFDGLDMIKFLEGTDRIAPVILAVNNSDGESHLVAEALDQESVQHVHRKS